MLRMLIESTLDSAPYLPKCPERCSVLMTAPEQPKAKVAGQGVGARGLWKSAIAQVQDDNRQQTGGHAGNLETAHSLEATSSIIQDRKASNSAAAPAVPKLAVMIHSAYNPPGSKPSRTPPSSDSGTPFANACKASSSSKGRPECYYVRACLSHSHTPAIFLQKEKTAGVMQAGGHVCWDDGLLQLEPHGDVGQLELLLQLKRRIRLTGSSVVVGSVRVPLREVVASPEKWGTKQQLQLMGHKTGAGSMLEVQLFLARASVPSPLQVLCATWNVGNALPPPPEQLQQWLKGATEGEHHLIAVAAQECNYTKDMRRYVSQHKRSSVSTAADNTPATTTTTAVQPFAPDAGSTGSSSPAAGDDAPVTPSSEAVAEATAPELQAAGEVLQDKGAAVAVAVAFDGDALLASHQLGSARAALKARLVDAVDSSAMWERHISNTLGEKYWLVGSRHMFQTRLLLYARADVVPSLSQISSGFEATGIGHVGMNKGAVAIGLKVGTTHIAFVGSHLAAHQSKTLMRNRDVCEICHELDLKESTAAAGSDLVTGFHHVVWMGDLNYRLDYGQQAETQSDSPTPEDFDSLCATIKQQRYDGLLPLDQLQRQRDAGAVFCGFSEGSITFPPTFKVHKGEPGLMYANKRSPAWCDRVLFKSVLPHRQASCREYYTVPDICSSDHKPVAAVLSLPMATHTVAAVHRCQSASSSPGTASPQRSSESPTLISPSSSKVLSRTTSWTAAAAAKLGLRGFSRRSSTATNATLYKLYLASVCLGDQDTWAKLVVLADMSKRMDRDNSSGDSEKAQQGAKGSKLRTQFSRSLSSAGGSSSKGSMRLQLVVSGACMAGFRGEHVVWLNGDSIRAARTAEEQPSLLLREDSIQLLPGPLSQLTDDWLLVRLVLTDGWKSKKTLARGILPLQPVVAAYRSSYKATPVTLQLESSSAAVGSLVCTVQLISSASIRAGMHEAIRRMRAMAADTRSTSQGTEGNETAAAVVNKQAPGKGALASVGLGEAATAAVNA